IVRGCKSSGRQLNELSKIRKILVRTRYGPERIALGQFAFTNVDTPDTWTSYDRVTERSCAALRESKESGMEISDARMTTKPFRDCRRLAVDSRQKMFDDLIQKKVIPEEAWPEPMIEQFLIYLANMDTNNRIDMAPIGAGEREGRVASPLVARLHLHMSHGIGRSGNLTECQPKAQGSSMLAQIANEFVLQTIKLMGIPSCKGALIVPMATGMTLSLCLSSWRRSKPEAKYVIFSRIDQKSCFKSILFAGYEPITVDPIRDSETDSLKTNVEGIRSVIRNRPEQVLAVLTTTSCFAPRAPDDVLEIAKLCSEFGLYHLVNNAYGLQSRKCVELLEEASREGRIDAFVQSTDKNFLIPVGGAVVGTFKKAKVEAIAQFYPGRASAIPSRDYMITSLHLGKSGWRELLQQREELFALMKTKLEAFARSIGETVLDVPENLISLAMTLKTIPASKQTLFGSILFSRGITGARVVPSTMAKKSIEGYEFMNFGSHTAEQHVGYLNVACGIDETLSVLQIYRNPSKTLTVECKHDNVRS
uniref:O-phosphoseryl-tRNA(Sec) selenium transferase n=1 Tax=Steinernema glaseri TaxID=37863 RepID=A0A1I7Y2Q9_9BILA